MFFFVFASFPPFISFRVTHSLHTDCDEHTYEIIPKTIASTQATKIIKINKNEHTDTTSVRFIIFISNMSHKFLCKFSTREAIRWCVCVCMVKYLTTEENRQREKEREKTEQKIIMMYGIVGMRRCVVLCYVWSMFHQIYIYIKVIRSAFVVVQYGLFKIVDQDNALVGERNRNTTNSHYDGNREKTTNENDDDNYENINM